MLQGILLVSRMIYLNYARVRCACAFPSISRFTSSNLCRKNAPSPFASHVFGALLLPRYIYMFCVVLFVCCCARSCSCDGGMSVLEKMSVIFFLLFLFQKAMQFCIYLYRRGNCGYEPNVLCVYRLRARIRTRARSFFFYYYYYCDKIAYCFCCRHHTFSCKFKEFCWRIISFVLPHSLRWLTQDDARRVHFILI